MRLTEQEAADLLTHGDPIELGRAADAERRRRFGDTVTFIVDRNINYTNICVNECRFCAFYTKVGAEDGYLLPMEEILAKVGETAEAGGTQVMIQGGIHPDLPLSYYENMLRAIRDRYPSIVIHSFTATEILYFAEKEGITIEDTLRFIRSSVIDAERGDYVFVIVCEGRFAGLIGFKDTDRENRRTELGYWLCEEYQGRGLMTAAVSALCRWMFKRQRMCRVQIKCATENARSRAIPERLGFVHEGTERCGVRLANGRYTDLEVYSRLRTDKTKK